MDGWLWAIRNDGWCIFGVCADGRGRGESWLYTLVHDAMWMNGSCTRVYNTIMCKCNWYRMDGWMVVNSDKCSNGMNLM